MGRSKARGGRGGGRAFKERNRDDGKRQTLADTFQARPEGNDVFESYYKTQGFIPETEWEDFMSALRVELPTTFRVTGSRAHAAAINDHISEKFGPLLQNVILDGEAQPAPKQLEWYPGKLAWQLNVPKRTIRKSPEYKAFQSFLVGETEIGNISRQEAVSMIPPLLLDVQPHHICLDMCAAPGSKTSQIMEALNPHTTPSTGLLIANDADAKRCHMLVHQTGRMPSIGLGVTCNDASAFPTLKIDERKTQNLTFDRILADVPCSGDGTMRKNPDIWKTWTVGNGNSLHPIQLRIIARAMQLLKVEGRLVYSTCSFNPSENESVVAAAMNLFPDQFRIVPVPDALPGLKRRKGLTSWKVATQLADGSLNWHETHAEHLGFADGLEGGVNALSMDLQEDAGYLAGRQAGQEKKSGKKDAKVKRWPETVYAPENVESLGLEHALRLLPHDQNTGGFFVCVLERVQKGNMKEGGEKKVKSELATGTKRAVSPAAADRQASSKKAKVEIPAAEEGAEVVQAETKPKVEEPVKETKQGRSDPQFKEDPFFFVDPNDVELQSCVKFFDLSADFPVDRVFVRNGTGEVSRTMYIANVALKSLIQGNDYSHAHLLSAGIKIFTRQDSRTNPTDNYCKWRIPNEGLSTMLPYLKKESIIPADVDDLRGLLQEQYPIIHEEDGGLKGLMREKSQGCHIVTFAPNDGKDGRGALHLPLTLPLWKGIGSLSLLIDKKEKVTLSLRTYDKDICSWTGLKKDTKSDPATQLEATAGEEGIVGGAVAVAQGEEAALVEKEVEATDKAE